MKNLMIFNQSDIQKAKLEADTLLELVENSIAGISTGASMNPPKISIQPVNKSMIISMLAGDKNTGALGMKAYTEFPIEDGRSQVGSTITLFDQTNGAPKAYMDCEWITAVRTAAVSALFAREASIKKPKNLLLIGAGAQGKEAIEPLIKACPSIKNISIYAPRQQAVEDLIAAKLNNLGDRKLTYCLNPEKAAGEADIIVGAGGPGAHNLIKYHMLKPGCTAILLGYGLCGDILVNADRVLATSEAQMHTTGKDLVEADDFPTVDAELPDILAGRVKGRLAEDEIIFAYNSGLAVTDIVVAHEVYSNLIANNIGQQVQL